MSTIKIHDKEFVKSIPSEEIAARVKQVAEAINRDYAGKRPLFLGVLNGCFMFVSDLMKNIEVECEISFVKFSSYQGSETDYHIQFLLHHLQNTFLKFFD